MCVGVLAYMYVCAPQANLVPMEAKKGIRCPGAEVTGGCELPYGCWDKPALLEEQLGFLTAELPLQPEWESD